MIITADHVKELASLFGDTVLVPQPGVHDLWVISTTNQHYQGAQTVYATGEQVTDLAVESDYDEDGNLTDAAAERIARKLGETPREEAKGYARGMTQNDDGSRRMAEDAARSILAKVAGALAEAEEWQAAHPNVADWRVTELLAKLRRARTMGDYLLANTDPEGDAARAAIRAAAPKEYVIQGKYEGGWEDVHTEETREGADEQLKIYNQAEPNIPHRVRERIARD
jgi:hypothetical protein